MKRTQLFRILVLSVSVFFMFSCSDDDDTTVVKIKISAETADRAYSYPLGKGILQEALKVKIGNSEEWELMDLHEIQGFRYQDGTEYQLEVTRMNMDMLECNCWNPYILKKVISATVVDKSILQVVRYNYSDRSATVKGDKLTEFEKAEIESKILSTLPDVQTYRAYKFIYTNLESPQGKVAIYTGDKKEEGTFEETKMENESLLKLRLGEREHTYIRGVHVSRSPAAARCYFTEDVTEMYKADYPNLETALARQEVYTLIGW